MPNTLLEKVVEETAINPSPSKYGGKNRKKCTIFDAASFVRGIPDMTKYANTATNPEAKLMAMMEICAVL